MRRLLALTAFALLTLPALAFGQVRVDRLEPVAARLETMR